MIPFTQERLPKTFCMLADLDKHVSERLFMDVVNLVHSRWDQACVRPYSLSDAGILAAIDIFWRDNPNKISLYATNIMHSILISLRTEMMTNEDFQSEYYHSESDGSEVDECIDEFYDASDTIESLMNAPYLRTDEEWAHDICLEYESTYGYKTDEAMYETVCDLIIDAYEHNTKTNKNF